LRSVAALPLALSIALVSALPARAQDSSPGVGDSAYVAGDYRVYTGAGESATIDDIVAAMGDYTVVFVGEAHDDPTGHMLEGELLKRAYEAYAAASAEGEDEGRPLALSLEFFQSDAQPVLDEYLAGLITESSFRAAARPWPRYETDYRELIEFSKENGLDVIAANAPRRYTTRVTMHGRESLDDLPPEALQWLAPLPYGQPSEAYRNQWIAIIQEVMAQQGMKCGIPAEELAAATGQEVEAPAPVGAHDNMGNQLHSQVLWDATMAYFMSEYLATNPDALLMHMVGGFHVERWTGTPEHLEAYRPGTKAMVVVLQPVPDVDTFEPAPEGEWGDFVIQTDESHTLEEIECRRLLAEVEARADA
ncbi:MAG: ChaN family lipoprotein, partial [marine benthic group bacterium]|nr:ChaN family lipoprotein [Candidatus Benthicola marisminoris]